MPSANFVCTGFWKFVSYVFSEGPECNLPSLLAYLILRNPHEGRRQVEMDKAMGKAKEAKGALWLSPSR
jgi:hypothetical protein